MAREANVLHLLLPCKTSNIRNGNTSVQYFEIQLLLHKGLNSQHAITVLQTEQSRKKLSQHELQKIKTKNSLRKGTVC